MAGGRPSKLTADEDIALCLAVIQLAADKGDKDAAAWLRDEGYIGLSPDEPHEALFIRYNTQTERYTTEYTHWRSAIFKRDNFTCQDCGQVGGKLHAHHVKAWSLYPKLRFVIGNGVTLCEACHAKRHRKAFNGGQRGQESKAKP